MFVTRPAFEQRMPLGLGDDSSRYWLAVMLSVESPWFLLTHMTAGGATNAVAQTVAVAWETTLMELLDSIGGESVVALRYIAPSNAPKRGWTMKEVSELWSASDVEADRTGPLLIRFRNEADLLDCFQGKVGGATEGRRLLVRICADS